LPIGIYGMSSGSAENGWPRVFVAGLLRDPGWADLTQLYGDELKQQ
jgi:hypothetical protein